MIPPEVVDQVRESADIVQIIGEHVKLRRAGGDFRGPCPFHGGKNPNFSVSPRRHGYRCFKCGESGNVFTFLQKHLGMSFPDAVRAVADTAGIIVPDSSAARPGPDPREPFWEMNAAAAEFFRTALWETDAGGVGREYLGSRGLDRASADRFGLGYAPADAGALRAHLETLGYTTERLAEAGLLVQPDGEREPRPRFRHRLVFPILDASGRHIAFGARALGDAEPKYLNSPETPVFVKRRTLYALNWCRNEIRRADRVFVVEGYFDAIRVMLSGLDTVVAPLGTALTDEQAATLARLTTNVYLLYDSDAAGLKATFRAGDELLRHGCAVRVVTLPEGEDPDSFVRGHGAAGLEGALADSVDVFERKVQILERGGWFTELQRKRRALDRLLPTIRAASDPILRELYVSRAAGAAGVAREVLLREVEERPPARPAAPPSPPAPRDRPHVRRRERRTDRAVAGRSAERELVTVMLADPLRVPAIADKVGPERFRDPQCRAIFAALLGLGDELEPLHLERLARHLDPDSIATLGELMEEVPSIGDPEASVAGSVAALAARDIQERLSEIDREITVASEAEKTALTAEKQRLQAEILLLGQSPNRLFKFLRPRPEVRSE